MAKRFLFLTFFGVSLFAIVSTIALAQSITSGDITSNTSSQ